MHSICQQECSVPWDHKNVSKVKCALKNCTKLVLERWDSLHLCVMEEQSGSVVPAPKPEGMNRALWVTCMWCGALKSHTHQSCWSCFGAHTLLSVVWCFTLELKPWFLFAANEIHFTASVSQPLMIWTSCTAQAFHSWQDPTHAQGTNCWRTLCPLWFWAALGNAAGNNSHLSYFGNCTHGLF